MTIVYDRNSFSYTENGSILQDRGDDSMKQNAKNKLISELDPVRWHVLEDNTMVLISLKKSDGESKTCRTSLGDLKRYLLGEILESLNERNGEGTTPPRSKD